MFVIAVKREAKKSGKLKPYSYWVSEEKMMEPVTAFFSSAMRFESEVEAESYAMLFGMKYRDYFGRLEVVEAKE